MTTIAFDGQYLVADTLVNHGDVKRRGRKLHIFGSSFTMASEGYWAVAVCGETQKGLLFLEWFLNGAKIEERPPIKEPFAAIVIDLQYLTAMEYENYCIEDQFTEKFYANGSGRDIALTAMMLGRNAVDAVELACDLNLFTGRPVEYIDINHPEKGIQMHVKGERL